VKLGYSEVQGEGGNGVFLQLFMQATVPARKPIPAWALLRGSQFLPEACSCLGSLWAAASFRACPRAVAWGPPQAAGRGLLHHGPLCAAGGQPASRWSVPQAAGEPMLQHLEHLLLLLH